MTSVLKQERNSYICDINTLNTAPQDAFLQSSDIGGDCCPSAAPLRAVPAVTVAVGAHGFYNFGNFIKEGAELARRAEEQKQMDPVRKVKQGKVKKTRKKFRARLRRRAIVTSYEETNIDCHES